MLQCTRSNWTTIVRASNNSLQVASSRARISGTVAASNISPMSRTGIAVAAVFLGLALFQGTRGLFASDAAPSPLPPPVSATPSPTVEPTPSKAPRLKPFPTFKGPAPEAQGYGSTEELAAALDKQGITCDSVEYLDQPDPTLSEFSLCDVGAEVRRFNIYFYETPKNRAVWVSSMKAQKVPQPLVWGPNWIVVGSGDPETAMKRIKAVRGAIGGTIEDFAPKQ